jgi:geranylgeranyl diphosphate synthase type I
LLRRNVDKANHDAVCYQCKVGGKRVRPALAVLSCQLFGGSQRDALYPAAALEILHNSTLIVDDIIDHSDFRRDLPTTWKHYGQSIAECVSMTYLASVFQGANMGKNGKRLSDLYSKTIKVVVNGEIKDILFERCGREEERFVVEKRYKKITKEHYFEMVGQKTAALLRASCEAGAICANTGERNIKIIGNYGFHLGIAFQIQDDILDIFGDEKKFGKKIGKDIIEKKMGNFVLLSALEELSKKEKTEIQNRLCGTKKVVDRDIKKVIALIGKTNAREIAEKVARNHIKIALKDFGKLPNNVYRDALTELALYVVERDK